MYILLAMACFAFVSGCGQNTMGMGRDSAASMDAASDPCTGPMSIVIPFGVRRDVDRCGANCVCTPNRVLECTAGICATPPPNVGCNTLQLSGNPAFVRYTPEPLPGRTGGVIAPGLYQLERVVVHGSAESLMVIPTLKMSLRITASTWDFASQEESVISRATFDVQSSGTAVTLTANCGAPRNPVTFSVVGTELHLQWTDRNMQRVYQYLKVE